MKKVIMPVKAKTYGGRWFHTHIFIEYTDGRLSITGVEGALASGNCLGSCGQIDMDYRKGHLGKDFQMIDGWTLPMFRKLLAIWDKWHLNDLKAGCEHQRALGWEADGYDKHPSEPCPTCGYKFGTAWHMVAVPNDVIAWLFSLPEAAKPCPWRS